MIKQKKIFILFFLLNFSFLCFPQISNSDFENWTETKYENLMFWNKTGNVTSYQSAYSGEYAVKLEQNPEHFGTAFIFHGDYKDGVGFIGGIPFNERPDSLKGFFKCYSPNPNNAGIILVIFKNNGVIISEDIFPVGVSADTSQYQEHKFKINYNHPSLVPDSVIILVSHPGAFQDTAYGGYLIVDELSFTNADTEILNGNFEQWDITSYECPDKWATLNFLATDAETYPVSKTEDAYSGDYAVRVQNVINENDNILGLLRSSELSTLSDGGAMEINDYYTSLSGHYKYFPENNDTMMILMFFYKADTMAGAAVFSQHETVDEYTKFDIPIQYFDNLFENPDSALIYIIAGNFDNPQGNSVLYIDDLQLVKNTNIIINEFVSSNTSTYFDEQNDAEDWIELYNAGSSPLFLNNYFISDNQNNIKKWRFPPVLLKPNGYLTVFASGKDRYWMNLHTNFKISSDGEPLILSSPTGEILDFVHPVQLPANVSYGRYPNAGTNFVYFAKPTPNKPNVSTPFYGFSDIVPDFSAPGGFYTDSLFLSLSCSDPNAVIYYTLDGSEPTLASNIYESPILIKSREGDENIISNIQTTHDFFWKELENEIFKATPVRARVFLPGQISLNTVTHTYFIDDNIYNRYDLPVISLVTDNDNLFDHNKGIYVMGVTYEKWQNENPNDTSFLWNPANYFNRGAAWERNVHVEFFENSASTLGFSQNMGLRIHGGASRMWRHKSLRLYSRKAYESDYINYPVFPELKRNLSQQSLTEFKRLILRNSGNDCEVTFFRDGLVHTLVNHTQIDLMAFQPSIVFINGEFWGFHNIRERQDRYYLKSHYNIDEDNVAILASNSHINHGNPGDELHYKGLLDYVENNDLEDTIHYDFISKLMDVDNFLDYNAIQIYARNTDWPWNNIKYWRTNIPDYNPNVSVGKDGRWRWLLFDTDFGFGLIDGLEAPTHNTLEHATSLVNEHFPEFDTEWSTVLFRNLLNNEKFKTDYINRTADHINTSFKPNRVNKVIDSLQNIYESSMPEHIERWHYSYPIQKWYNNIDVMRHFANLRPQFMHQHIIERWDLSGISDVTLNVSDKEHGKIKMSTIVIDKNTKGVSPNVYPWVGKYFNDVQIPVRAIAYPGYKFIKWEGTEITDELIFITLSNDTALTALFEIDPDYDGQFLFINEFMASNNSIVADEFGEFDDWIEIYNSSNDTVDLAGYFMTDNFSNPQKHKIVTGCENTKIPPGGFLLLWADNQTEQGCLHLSFKLSAGGEYIALIAPDGITVIDSISFGPQITDVSYGRYPDGNDNWIYFEKPTPGASNVLSYVKDHNNLDDDIAIYPNPATDIVYLTKTADVKIYNISGQLVYETKNTDLINLSRFEKGMYFVRINENNVKKLIIN